MSDVHEIEIWAAVDADGDYATGQSQEEVIENYHDNIGGDSGYRVVKVVLTVPLTPVCTVVAELPDRAGSVEATVEG